ncbi:hypothetical protein FQN54_000837 [Arachnomyces sp. PD_36]|nr:hypothetical protein FQN54_000837 [Arachnomyces sp. PD_36]
MDQFTLHPEQIEDIKREIVAAELRQKDRQREFEELWSRAKPDNQASTLSELLHGCHLLSMAIRIGPDAKEPLTDDMNNTPRRIFPSRIIPWHGFPDLQEQVWEKLDAELTLTLKRLFASKRQLCYISEATKVITSHFTLQDFEHRTVEAFVGDIVDSIYENEALRNEFRLFEKVAVRRHMNVGCTSRRPDDSEPSISHHSTCLSPSESQFCVYAAAAERQRPLYAIEFITPHELTVAELAFGLREMEISRDIVGQAGKSSFEVHSQHLVAAAITQLYDYMIHSGVKCGYLYTGEAYVFLHIMDDPSVLQYFLSVPNLDVNRSDEHHLHRTAVAQVLAFTLNALVAESPLQQWYEAAFAQPRWKIEYRSVLDNIPEYARGHPPPFEYKPSTWKRVDLSLYPSTPVPSSDMDAEESLSDNFDGLYDRGAPMEYCTMQCLHGLANGGPLDHSCPNVCLHGDERHTLTAGQFIDNLHFQLTKNRERDFEQLNICGKTCFLLKASSRDGYTVLIKATTESRSSGLQHEYDVYNHLAHLQNRFIPVCLGLFSPQVPYFYHGKILTQMLVLSWAGERASPVSTGYEYDDLCDMREKLLLILHLHGVDHIDTAWRNMLWSHEAKGLVIIDFEDALWVSEASTSSPDPIKEEETMS